jgi:hypothetical protein
LVVVKESFFPLKFSFFLDAKHSPEEEGKDKVSFLNTCFSLPTFFQMAFFLTWDQCYDFKNIFTEKLGKIGVFAQTTAM